jgi:hypothetical protein
MKLAGLCPRIVPPLGSFAMPLRRGMINAIFVIQTLVFSHPNSSLWHS